LTPRVRRGGKGKWENQAVRVLLRYKLKVRKGIPLYGKKGKREKSSC